MNAMVETHTRRAASGAILLSLGLTVACGGGAEPLTLAWVAANRIASDGEVWGPHQRVSLDLALRAITLEAAWSLGLEDEIGSIAPGKRADFTVLERDPYEVPIEELNRISIWGTVFEGRLYPLD